MPTYSWVSPTSHSDPSLTWQDPANAYDGDWDTSAWNIKGAGYTAFLTLILPSTMWIDRIRFKYAHDIANKKIDIDVYDVDAGSWVNIIDAAYPYNVQNTIVLPVEKTDRIRVRIDNALFVVLFEVDVEQVIPDTPAPPSNPPEVYVKRETKQMGEPTLETTRVRVLHRVTEIKPVVIG
jgi:hypothetical protein